MRALGIDFGTKRIGVAVSDDAGSIAYPRIVVRAGSNALDEVQKFAQEERIEAVVMGDSRDSDMRENSIMETARPFGEELAKRLGVPLHFELESFTTAATLAFGAAMRKRDPGRPSRAPREREGHDAAAAAVMLQRFLERADGQP
jgi:putative Holliday junction resolvase